MFFHSYNDRILHRVPGELPEYMSADSLQEGRSDDDKDTSAIPYSSVLNYVANHPPTGIPPAKLTVKVGGIYRILRNFSIDPNLVKNAGVQLISVHLLNGPFSMENEDILLPRISSTSRLPSRHTLMICKQFPLTPAYATTFNSCQGRNRNGLDKWRCDSELKRIRYCHLQSTEFQILVLIQTLFSVKTLLTTL